MRPIPSSICALFFALLLAATLAERTYAEPSFFWANPKPSGTELGGVEFESASVGYAVGHYSTVMRTTDAGVTWQELSTLDATSPHFDDVLVVAPGVLLAAGGTPSIFRSTDSGASWNPVANPSNAPLRNIFALDASRFFAVGDNGNVLRSTNAGATWSLLSSPSSNRIVDQWWLDDQRGFVIGEFLVRSTTNGGASWATIPGISEFVTSLPGDVQFLDDVNGWIFLDFDTYRTTNGGASWFPLTAFGEFPIYQEEALLVNAQTRLVATEAEGATILKTTNDGTNWTVLFDHPGSRGITDLERLPGGAIIATSTDGDLLRSMDEGVTWTNSTDVAGTPERANGNVIDVGNAGVGFAGGFNDLWIQTTNSGVSWFDPPSTPGLHEVFAVCVRDPQFFLAGGSGTTGQSDVRRSTNGGTTWTTHSLSASYVGYPQGLAAFDDGTCYTGTYGGTNIGTVFRSTDSGQTWHTRNTGLSGGRIFDLFFIDSQIGFVCGGDFGNPMIARTTNGGAQWTAVGESGLVSDLIRDMHWFSVNDGVVVGGSRVQRTTNGGGSWATVSMQVGGEAIDFFDATRGVADAFPHDIGVTTDGGVTWTRVPMPMDGFVSDVVSAGNDAFALGGSNSILGMDADGAPVAADEIAPPNAAATLFMWPNPLHAGAARTLFFRAEESASAPWEARLYDVSGRVLARERIAAGAREGRMSLESLRLFPGVVFLRVRTEDGASVARKVTILR